MSTLSRDLMPPLTLDASTHTDTVRDLDLTTSNAACYHALVGHACVQEMTTLHRLSLPTGYRLVCVTARLGADRFEMALVHDHAAQIAYYNQVVIHHDILTRPLAHPQCVWRSFHQQHKMALRDLHCAVLFDYILARYHVMVRDNIRTGVGMHIWKGWVSEAIFRQIFVYHYEPGTRALRQIRTHAALNSLSDNIWGATQPRAQQLAILSSIPLPSHAKIRL